MIYGKINWQNLPAYTVQPSDMELFQTYMVNRSQYQVGQTRSVGLISGGVITPTSGLGLSISAGLALMPDGSVIAFPALTATLAAADPTNPRIDRIELSYTPTNNTQVVDTNSITKTLDILYTPSLNIETGTALSTPSPQSPTSSNISLGLVSVTAGQNTLLLGNISQIVDSGLVLSAIQVGPTGSIRYNRSSSLMQYTNDGIRYQSLGSGGGGGGGGANWQGVVGLAPLENYEIDDRAFQFQSGAGQAMALVQKIGSSYLPGSPIRMKLTHYTPDASGDFLFQATTTLIRKNQDSVFSTALQWVSTNTDQVLSVANQSLEQVYDLSTPAGLIGGVTASPGDSIKIIISRVTPAGIDAPNDVRMIPSSTEILFS